MAQAMIGQREWMKWSEAHPNLEYTGSPLGTAIFGMLTFNAWITAAEYSRKASKQFNPSMNLEGISLKLEEGGYEFKSTTPLRETNAALIKLKGVVKTKSGTYQVEDADTYLGYFSQKEEPPTEEGPPPDDVDDLPF